MSLSHLLTPKRKRLFWASYSVSVLVVAVIGALGGLLFGYAIDLPQVDRLQEVRPNIVSYVYSDDGRVLGQFALERRVLVSYDQIPETLMNAILSTEDASVLDHSGIDFRRLFVAAVRDIVLGERKGASTLTMQLSKLLFTSSEKTIERKIKDMLFALEIEKNYSKEQIFTFYCNQIYMGHGTYGIASAADLYFNKSLEELTLAESALLAGTIQVPERHSPINHPERALSRRNLVLRRMYDEEYIDVVTFQETLAEPLLVRRKNYEQSPAPYFVEWVRQYLEKHYSTEQIWEGGLRIYTTLDYDMQVAAHRALRQGLIAFDKEHTPWKPSMKSGLERIENLDSYVHPEWRQFFYEGQLVHGLVLESNSKQATVKIGSYTALIQSEDIEWTEQKQVDYVLKKGDIATFLIESIDRSDKTIDARLDRIPEVQGALLALDNGSGAIKAMVGGFDFQYSKFNRATQALRQPGSIFKPFTYVAALERGYSPSDKILDAPVSFRDSLGRVYAPENSDQKFKGLIPIRNALAQSRNVPTIRLANDLGIETIIEVAHRFGIDRNFPPYLPIALGAGELTLQEITSAFTVFPNRGVRLEPFFIQRVEDYNGVTLEEHHNQFRQATSPETAEKMINLLTGVVEMGTARRARALNRPIGGKTGTTNESTDSWFVGFTPQITAGVWSGYDEKKSLGKKVYGSTLALPIWIDFMEEIYQDLPAEEFDLTSTSSGRNPVPERVVGTGEELLEAPWSVEDIPPPSASAP